MTLLRKVLTASFIMLLAVSAQAAMKMERQQISKLNLSLEIPQTLTPMPDEMAKIKYPSENRPQVIYGDERGKAWLITFRSQAPDTEILNMLLITSQNEKAVQVSFNMTKDLVAQYHEAAKASLLSLKFE